MSGAFFPLCLVPNHAGGSDMKILRVVRRFIRAVIPPTLFLALTGYFGWQATQGDHGLKAYGEQIHLLDEAKISEKNAIEEQAIWKRRVAALKETALDPDVLDERSRAMLNLAHGNEIVVPYDRHDRLY